MGGVHGSPASDIEESAITTRYERSENDKLFDEISDIKAKLDYIINHFIMEKEGLGNPEKKYVNISASGIRFTVNHPVKVKDVMEVKLLLPTYPPVAVFAYGEVKRVRDIGNGKHEVAIEYVNMSESVRNEIIQYTLSHQRETIKKFKESRSEE
jgi:c-di-GMP-binding flagellar brake protein YcgR